MAPRIPRRAAGQTRRPEDRSWVRSSVGGIELPVKIKPIPGSSAPGSVLFSFPKMSLHTAVICLHSSQRGASRGPAPDPGRSVRSLLSLFSVQEMFFPISAFLCLFCVCSRSPCRGAAPLHGCLPLDYLRIARGGDQLPSSMIFWHFSTQLFTRAVVFSWVLYFSGCWDRSTRSWMSTLATMSCQWAEVGRAWASST